MSVVYVFPGQGSQKKGMGNCLFDKYPELTRKADEILGYSIKDMCLYDAMNNLNNTEYSQAAIFFVNALNYYEQIKDGIRPDFVAGHSLGEYNALLAAGAFDFETGLFLVQQRGHIMSGANGGGMAAVIGLSEEEVAGIIRDHGLTSLDIANCNSPSQIVVSGPDGDIEKSRAAFEKSGASFIRLKVSGAFHSRYMEPCKAKFGDCLDNVEFNDLRIPVIANLTARPYKNIDIRKNLKLQLVSPVKWTDSIRYLMGKGQSNFKEIGESHVLTGLISKIAKEAEPLITDEQNSISTITESNDNKRAGKNTSNILPFKLTSENLGSADYKSAYGLKFAYSAGSMYKATSSSKMVIAMAKAGMMSYLGTGGLSADAIQSEINTIKQELSSNSSFGLNLIYNLYNPKSDEQIVDLFIKNDIRYIEASAYMQISPALVRFRAHGLEKEQDGRIVSNTRVQAKISRPEVAQLFLSPAPEKILKKLLQDGKITEQQAELAGKVPIATEICVESDSGGHTDRGRIFVLIPTILRLRDEMQKKFGYSERVNLGAAGGIGTPEAAAAAFLLGADYIQTGSINQCTVEAGMSNSVKDILQGINVQDTDYAPAGDMFELGAKVQVLKKGVFFPARANKLYELYKQYNSLDEIDAKQKSQIETMYFKKSFEEVFKECIDYYPEAEIKKAMENPKVKMAMVFKWYFGHCTRAAQNGDETNKVNYQVHCGPALGAFNQWVKGTPLENWRNRHVDEMAIKLMDGTAEYINSKFQI